MVKTIKVRPLLVLAVLLSATLGCVQRPYPQEMLPVPSQEELVRASQEIAALTMQNKGATYNLYEGNMAGQPLYAVSVFPERTEEVEEYPGAGRIHEFIQRNLELLRARGFHVGTWYNDALGRTYLEVSVTVSDLAEAKRLGRKYEETTVYDMSLMQELAL